MPANRKNSAVAIGLEKVSFHFNPKERQCQRMLKLPYNCTPVTRCKVMLKILQARLQQYMNWELSNWIYKRQRNKRPNCQHMLDHRKASEFQKNIYFCLIDYTKAFDCVDHNKLWRILQEMGIPDHLTCLLGRKVMTNLDSILKSRDITLSN